MPAVRESALVNFLTLKDAPELRAELLRNVTALLGMVADSCGDRLLDTYDAVLMRLCDMTEPAVRADIAARLARVARAPGGVVRKLALDEIAIAHPLLVLSPVLGEADLIGIAQLRGNPHRRAIATRPGIGRELADLLVARGDGAVRRAVAANPTAALGQRTFRHLLAEAESDVALQQLIAAHPATPPQVLADLGRFAAPEVRVELAGRGAVADQPRNEPVPDHALFAVYDFEAAVLRIEDWLEDGNPLDIETAGQFAADNRFAEAAVTLARLSGFGLSAVLDWFATRDTRTVVLVTRALGGSEAALRGLLAAGSWRFAIGADRRREALAEFRALAVEAAQALLEQASA